MANKPSRRRFLQATAVAGIGYWVAGGVRAEESKSPNEKIRFAAVGVGGMGHNDSANAGLAGEMVAICDVDERTLNGAAGRFPKAKKFFDFRKMLEEMEDQIDAVTVSTPDHNHAAAGLMAMRMGMHCFCQKPMTRTVYEARLMGQVAKEKNVATQMGNQGTANRELRRAAALVKAGAIGTVREAHVFTNRPIWDQGIDRPKSVPVPPFLKWDLWLGTAPERPYAPGYHAFAWRGWWDFGTGSLGDMACHTLNMPYAALDLRDPVSVQAESSGHNRDSFPVWTVIEYDFPANDWRPGLKLFWYDKFKRPPADVLPKNEDLNDEYRKRRRENNETSGALIVGDKGKLYSVGDYCSDFVMVGGNPDLKVEFEESPGHFEEWVRAIKGGKPAMSNFPDYASPLTETVVLGNLAVWVANEAGSRGPKVEWNAKEMKAGVPGVETLIKPVYSAGYKLD